MSIVGAYCCSHGGLMITRRELAPQAQQAIVAAAYNKMADEIGALVPDAIVVVGTDHGRVYPLEMPVSQFVVGVGPVAKGIGDAGLDKRDYRVHQELARAILGSALQAGVDMAYWENMSIDHSFVAPLMTALKTDIPIVPIFQNCNMPPLPSLSRSIAVGKGLREALTQSALRIVVMGTGGLSHWVGSKERQEFLRSAPGTRLLLQAQHPLVLTERGYVNESFDNECLKMFAEARVTDFVNSWTTERIYTEAGNGAQEVRNWLVVAGMVGDAPASVLGYAAIEEWLTGTAVIRFDV